MPGSGGARRGGDDHLGQGLSGEWQRACPRPGRRLGAPSLARGRCRVRAADARRPSPLPPGRWRPAVTRPLAPRLPTPRGCGWPVQRCRRSFRRESTPSRALPLVASLRDGASATLDSALPRQTHWHLSGWTGQSVARAATSGIRLYDLNYELSPCRGYYRRRCVAPSALVVEASQTCDLVPPLRSSGTQRSIH